MLQVSRKQGQYAVKYVYTIDDIAVTVVMHDIEGMTPEIEWYGVTHGDDSIRQAATLHTLLGEALADLARQKEWKYEDDLIAHRKVMA